MVMVESPLQCDLAWAELLEADACGTPAIVLTSKRFLTVEEMTWAIFPQLAMELRAMTSMYKADHLF